MESPSCRCGQKTASVPLGGLGGAYRAVVHEADSEHVAQYHWSVRLSTSGVAYARRYIWDGRIAHPQYLHTLLTGLPLVDHEDGDGLNNCRCNLRDTGNSGNGANSGKRRDGLTSRFKGVSRHLKGGWQVTIRKDGHRKWLGRFDVEEDAARAYDRAAVELHGEFARTNKMMGLL